MQSIHAFINAYRPILMVMYLSIMGLACTSSVMLYFGRSPNAFIGLVFMGFIFFIYMINRYSDTKEDFVNDINKAVFFSKHKTLFKIGVGVIILAVLSLVSLNKLNLYHVLLVSMGILYSYRLIPWYHKTQGIIYYRIKDLPLVKNLVVATLWGTSIFLVPIFFADINIGNFASVVLLSAGLILSTFTNTLFGDIMDVVGDKLSNSNTLPTLLGESFTYKVILSLNALWLATILGYYGWGIIDTYHFAFLLLMAIYPVLYIIPYQKKWLENQVIGLLMELDLLLFACGLVILSLVG